MRRRVPTIRSLIISADGVAVGLVAFNGGVQYAFTGSFSVLPDGTVATSRKQDCHTPERWLLAHRTPHEPEHSCDHRQNRTRFRRSGLRLLLFTPKESVTAAFNPFQ